MRAAEEDAAAAAADAEALRSLLLAAASELVGAALASEVLAVPKESARASKKLDDHGADFRCRAPRTLFRRLEALARRGADADADADAAKKIDDDAPVACGDVRVAWHREANAGGSDDGDDATASAPSATGVVVHTTTAYGTRRARHYPSAVELADAIVCAMDPASLSAVAAHVAVDRGSGGGGGGDDGDGGEGAATAAKRRRRRELLGRARENQNQNENGSGSGVISFMTKRRLLENAARGMLLCRACGVMFRGDKGLREHRQAKHANSYETSRKEVMDSRMALIAMGGGAATGTGTTTAAAMIDNGRTNAVAKEPEAFDEGLAAARDGDLNTLKTLVAERGWDPLQTVDKHGSCALHWAAGAGQLETCRYLVETCGVDPCVRRRRGKKSKNGPNKRDDGRAAMHWAARNGRTEVCAWLHFAHGVSVDDPTSDGTTPFHLAVWRGHVDTCRWLVDAARADWTTTNAFGCNAIQWAAQSGDVAMCAYLKRLGLDLTLLNCNGHSALHKAAVKGKAEVCAWLLSEGGLDGRHMLADGDGNTPQEMARLEGHDALARWLRARADELAR